MFINPEKKSLMLNIYCVCVCAGLDNHLIHQRIDLREKFTGKPANPMIGGVFTQNFESTHAPSLWFFQNDFEPPNDLLS